MAIEWGLRVVKIFRGVPLPLPFFGGRFGVFVRKTGVMDKYFHKSEGNQPEGNFLTGSDRPYKLLAKEMGGMGGWGGGARWWSFRPLPPFFFVAWAGAMGMRGPTVVDDKDSLTKMFPMASHP